MFNAKFNQPIGKWNVANVTDMNNMFAHTKFKPTIISKLQK